MSLNIAARKPRDGEGAEYVVVDRGEGHKHGRFVSATTNPPSLQQDLWYWGHYFDSSEEALRHFNERGAR